MIDRFLINSDHVAMAMARWRDVIGHHRAPKAICCLTQGYYVGCFSPRVHTAVRCKQNAVVISLASDVILLLHFLRCVFDCIDQ